MRRELTFFILIILTCFAAAQTNQQIFYNLTPESGLTETSINCVYQDYKQFIWIGTKDGLFRFDGENFKIYRKYRQDSTTLINSNVTFIYEDNDSVLWIGTVGGISKYNRAYDNFERVKFGGEYFRHHIFQIIEDDFGDLWIATTLGPLLVNRKDMVLENPAQDLWISNDYDYCQRIVKGDDGSLWFAYADDKWGGLLNYNHRSKFFKQYHAGNSKLKANNMTFVNGDEQGNLWIAYYNLGIEVFNVNDNSVKYHAHDPLDQSTISSDFVHNITLDKNGIIYVGTDNGLSVYNPKNDSFERYYASSSENSLLSNILNGVPYCSEENTLWFPCKGGGVSVIDSRHRKFSHFKNEPGNYKSLGHDRVINFTEDKDNRVWLSTDGGGIYLFDQINQSFKGFKHIPGNPNSLTNNKVLALCTDNNSGLFAGMWQGGIDYFKIEGDNLVLQKKFRKLNPNSGVSAIFTIYKDKQGGIWVGTYGDGLYKYSDESKSFTKVLYDSVLGNISVYAIEVDYKNNIWLGTTHQGVFKINDEDKSVVQYIYDSEDSTTIAADAVYAIMEDQQKRMWFATRGGGLCLYDAQIDGFINYTTSDGLPSNKIVGLIEDSNGNIWVSSNNGLSMLNFLYSNEQSFFNVEHYYVADGLQSSFFNAWSYFKSRNGTLYFGGNNGFNMFHPYSIKLNQTPPGLYLTDLLLFNQPVSYKNEESPLNNVISETSEILLEHDQSVITFKYNAISFVHNERCHYAYMLENFEKDWNYVATQKSATYTNLKPGNYVFKVKAANNDGIWNEEGISVRLTVKPAWWQTVAFRLFAIAFILFVLFVVYRLRVASLTKQKEHLQKVVTERTKELQSKNNELSQKQQEVQERNALLAVSEEELREANEELVYTNDELIEQRNELASTIDALKETQQQLVESEKMATVGILTAGIAHEINNPLNFIMGGKTGLEDYVEDELSDLESKSDLNKFIHMINEGVTRVTRIINGLNRFNRQTKDYNESCDIHFVLDNCLLMLHNRIKHKIEVVKEYTLEKIILKGNEGELHQVFLNILVNAVDAIEDKGVIKIITYRKDQSVGIEIIDSGIGISQDNMNKITSPFFTTKDPGSGTGLGLSISSSILSKHDGAMCFESEKGKGTTVYISLPVGE